MAPPNSYKPVFRLVSHLVWITLYILFLRYLHQLATHPECRCAKTRLRDTLMVLFTIKLFYHVGRLFFLNTPIPPIVTRVIVTVTLLEVVLVLMYLSHLRATLCTCSETATRIIIEVTAYIRLVLLGVLVMSCVSYVEWKATQQVKNKVTRT